MSHPTTRTRTKVLCFCKKCNGKPVDPRTRDTHKLKFSSSAEEPSNTWISNPESSNSGPSNTVDNDDPLPKIIDPIDPSPMIIDDVIEPLPLERNHSFLTKKRPIHESEKSYAKKGKISDQILENLLSDDEGDFDDGDENRDFEDFE